MRLRRVAAITLATVLAVCALAGVAAAQGGGNGGGGNGNGGGNGGGNGASGGGSGSSSAGGNPDPPGNGSPPASNGPPGPEGNPNAGSAPPPEPEPETPPAPESPPPGTSGSVPPESPGSGAANGGPPANGNANGPPGGAGNGNANGNGPPDGAGNGNGPPDGAGNGNGPPEGAGNGRGPREDRGRPNETGKPDGPRGRSNESRGNGPREDREERGADPVPPAGSGSGSGPPDGVPAGGEAPPGLERSSLPEEAREAPARVFVRRGEDPVEVARGDVAVAAENVDAASTVLVLVHPNGTEEVLAEGEPVGTWNTTRYENGYYTVEVRERRANGQTATIASTTILVENPRATAIAAVASVATGAVVSAGAGVAASRGFEILSLFKQGAADITGTVAEDAIRARTARAKRWKARSLAAGIGLVVAAGALLAFFKTYTLASSWEEVLLALPVAGTAVLVASAAEYGAEWSLARASGARTRFRLWAPGTISLVASSVLFRSSFGYPGYVDEDEPGDDAAPRQRALAGRRALAFLGVGVALSLPFLLIGRLWRWDFAEFGIGVALMMSAAASIPVRPMPGRDVWEWSRPAAVGMALLVTILYVLWQLAMLPAAVLAALGVLGAAGFFAALARLRHAA